MRKTLPTKGRGRDELMAELKALKGNDTDWQHGRAPLYVFRGIPGTYEIGRDAFVEYFTENALGAKRAFSSIKRMEDDVVGFGLDLFRAPDGATGTFTTGGTESIFLAVKTCRDWSRRQRKDPQHRGNLVLPVTAHPAFDKAAQIMDLTVRRVPHGPDFRADPKAMDTAVDADTIMMVGSAPNFSFGTIDPIAALGEIAQKRGVWLHVDACVGGYVAPFVKKIGYPIPDFDFAVPGVMSISADLHKFGFCPKPASTVFYRDQDKHSAQAFVFEGWPNGRYATETFAGTRAGGGVAASWATMNYLGVEGYCETARRLMAMRDGFVAEVEKIPGLHIWGKPDLTIVAIGAKDVDIHRVAEELAGKGWLPGLLREPKALHMMMSLIHEDSRATYVADLKEAVAAVKAGAGDKAKIAVTY